MIDRKRKLKSSTRKQSTVSNHDSVCDAEPKDFYETQLRRRFENLKERIGKAI